MRKEIIHKKLDLSRWSSDNLHLVGVELKDQPVRNIVNVYACNRSMKTEDWLVLDDMQSTLPGESIFCGDYNARISNNKDYVEQIDDLPERFGIDKNKNSHGDSLLEFLINNKVCIVNGRECSVHF